MRSKIVIFALSALALGLLVAGCGGSDSGSIDKAAFVEQAGSICEEVSGKIGAEAQSLGAKEGGKPGSSPAKTSIKLVTQIAVPGFETELEEIRALGVPSEGKQQVEAFLTAMQKMIKVAETDPKSFIDNSSPYESVELAGRQFGLSSCPIKPVNAS